MLKENLWLLVTVWGLWHTVEQFRLHPVEGSGILAHMLQAADSQELLHWPWGTVH